MDFWIGFVVGLLFGAGVMLFVLDMIWDRPKKERPVKMAFPDPERTILDPLPRPAKPQEMSQPAPESIRKVLSTAVDDSNMRMRESIQRRTIKP